MTVHYRRWNTWTKNPWWHIHCESNEKWWRYGDDKSTCPYCHENVKLDNTLPWMEHPANVAMIHKSDEPDSKTNPELK